MLYVKDIMSRKVETVEDSSTIYQAAVKLAKLKIGSLMVVRESKPVGILTEGDVSRAVAKGMDPKGGVVKSIMGKPLITITSDVRVEEAAKVMASSGVKKLPVLDGGKLIGIVTQTDIVGSSFDLVTALKEMVRARYRPPDFQP
jgi:CBS domain-containing protein